jgi:thymidylate synthase
MKPFIRNEIQYLKLVEQVLKYGEKKNGRNGTVLSYFGSQMRFSLKDNQMPLLTTKKLAWKTCLKELLWFIKGNTNNKLLKEVNVNIWNGNASKDFLSSRGLTHYEEDDLGPIYGFQWNNFNGSYRKYNDYDNNGINQLAYVINALKNNDINSKEENKYSRRLIISSWNPCQLNEMALPPCHILFQFYVNTEDELSCSLYQRSGDIGLGIPFNIASYSFLTHLIAKHTGLKPGYFIHTIGDAHIYEEHIDALKKQLNNKIYKSPTLFIKNIKANIHDYNIEDFVINDYIYNDKISMKMIV